MFWNPLTRWAATKLNALTTHVPPPPRAEDEPKRRVLLVHAHPRADSFSAALADAVEAGCREGGHEIRRRSLYQEKYQPALTATERKEHAEHEPGSAAVCSRESRSHLDDLRWCDSLVFVYPTWWFNVPAVLKGYFDRTLVAGHDGAWDMPAPRYAAEGVASNGLVPRLTNVRRLLGVSTYGAPRSIALLAGDNGRNCIGTAIRPVFAPDCTCHWLGLYEMDSCSRETRVGFLDRVRAYVRDEL